MYRVKQINKWIIKAKNEGELTIRYDRNLDNRFAVFSPEGKCMEDNLSLKQAENFCKENTDYVKK